MSERAADRILAALGRAGGPIRPGGGGYSARCPAHEDRSPSLSVRQIEGQALVYCHAGCDTADVMAALQLTMRDLFDEPGGARYQYTDAWGKPTRIVHRTPEKDFKQYGDKRIAQLYRLPKVLAAVAAGTAVYLVEGEKDVHALEALGATATTAPGGAVGIDNVDVDPLRGASVIAIADRDGRGAKWASDVLARLTGYAATVRVFEAAIGKDAADHIAAGHGLGEFKLLPLSKIPGVATATVVPRQPTAPDAETGDDAATYWASHTAAGGSFVLDTPDTPTRVWGGDKVIVWAQGESLMLCGPAGVGKTTLAQQLVAARMGVGTGEVLGMPVEPGKRRLLYLAMDRPPQIARAMGRLFTSEHRDILDAKLVVWKGPPPYDLAKRPEILLEMCERADADTVIVDSLKDAVMKLSDDEAGGGYNKARQRALVAGIEVIELHHQRKASGDNKKPSKLDDVYGSTWITAGAGSVLSLWGESGDPIIELTHLKQPMEPFGPVQVIHDHTTGLSEIHHETDLLNLTRMQGRVGMNAKLAAGSIFSTDKPTGAQVERARRKLDNLVRSGHLVVEEGRGGRGANASTYYLAAERGLMP